MGALIWIEGVDFDEHIGDSNEISVIRGGSLALLKIEGEALAAARRAAARLGAGAVEAVFSGASLALLRVADCDEATAERIAAAVLAGFAEVPDVVLGANGCPTRACTDAARDTPPLHQMRFVAGVSADTDDAAAVARAQGRARLMQVTGGYPRKPVRAGAGLCGMTRRRAADWKMSLTPDQNETRSEETGNPGPGPLPVSASAWFRRVYGRKARVDFLNERLAAVDPARDYRADPIDVVDDFHELVALEALERDLGAKGMLGPGRRMLPLSVEDKMAVLYADGNSFSKIRQGLKMGGSVGGPAALAHFAATMKELMDGKVLGGVLGLLAADAAATGTDAAALVRRHGASTEVWRQVDGAPRSGRALRFELLLYGGDEICFVVPAWYGFAVARASLEAVDGAAITDETGSKPLTFKAGLAIAHHKMPIASLRQLAHDIADAARVDGVNTLGFEIFESQEPPANGLAAYRRKLYGDSDGADAAMVRAAAFMPLRGDGIGAMLDGLARARAGGLARSKLYGALREAQWRQENGIGRRDWPGGLGTAAVNARAATEIDKYLATVAGARAAVGDLARDLTDPAHAALAAYRLTQMWDYVAPFEVAGLLEAARDVGEEVA